MALKKTQVSELYVAIFGRASEREGNKYWQTINGDISFIANNMLNTDAAKEYFGATLNDNKSFIEFIYKNTLNKTYAQDSKGIDYWTNQLNSGVSKGDVVSSMIYSINSYAPGKENYDANDLVTQKAYNQFINRVEVSDFTADMLLKAPYDYAVSTSFNKDLVVTDIKNSIKDAKWNLYKISQFENSKLKPQDISTIKMDVPVYVKNYETFEYFDDHELNYTYNYTYSYENGVLNRFSPAREYKISTQYIYDSKGNIIEIREFNYYGVLSSIHTIDYNSEGQEIAGEISFLNYIPDLPSDIFLSFLPKNSTYKTTWSSDGFISDVVTTYNDGYIVNGTLIGKGLNSPKNLPLEEKYYKNNELDYISYNEYDSNGNNIKTLDDHDANGTIDSISYSEWILIG